MPKTAVKLSDLVDELMDKQFGPQQLRLARIAGQWEQLLPAELCRHYKLADISGGQLKVLVDSPSCLYELQLCSSGLLEEMQMQCPQVRVKKIKFAVGVVT